jgi:hypothetical protein
MSLTELALREVGGPCPSRGIQWACHCHCHIQIIIYKEQDSAVLEGDEIRNTF